MTTAEMNTSSLTADRLTWWVDFLWKAARRDQFGIKTAWRETRYSWLGFTLIAGIIMRWIGNTEMIAMDRENYNIAKKQGLQYDVRPGQKERAKASRRQILFAFLAVALSLTALILYFVYDAVVFEWWKIQLTQFEAGFYGAVFSSILVCDAVGRKYVPEVKSEYSARPIEPLRSGISLTMLRKDIETILFVYCKEKKITFHGHRFIGDYGVEFDVHTTDTIGDAELRILEKHLQAGRGMIKLLGNKENTAAPILRVFWDDPLGEAVKPEEREPKSLSVYDGFSMFRDEMGKRVRAYVVGLHQFWTGRSGSGKSSALWVFLDWLLDCRDADVYGIDIGGTVFAPYRRLMAGVGRTTEEAEEILTKLVEECERRVALLDAKMDAEEEMEDENWRCTEKKGERGIWLIIDEYTKFAKHKHLRQMVDILYETGRKARVHIVVSTPDASKPAMGNSTAPITHAMMKVVFGTPFSMITPIFGPGSVEEGWRPDMLESAGDDGPGDSGKCYVSSAEFGKPILQRFDRLTLEDIYARNRKRRDHVTATVKLPEPLAILKAAFELNGKPEKLAVDKILEIPLAAGWTRDALRDSLRDLGKELNLAMPVHKKIRVGDTTTLGYEWTGVEAALKSVV
jgi:hypothetical protein